MPVRHFLSLMDLTPAEIRQVLNRSVQMKQAPLGSGGMTLLHQHTAVLVFEKSSTRTRVSFEAGINQLGGHAIFLAPSDSQLGRGEPIADTAKVLSRMTSLIIMRTSDHARVVEMAHNATIPVINGLSDFSHPCQLLADLQTWQEHRGEIAGKRVAWIGDGNNVCHSWMNAATQLDFQLMIATPAGYEPDMDLTKAHSDAVTLVREPVVAARQADLVVTDTWASMGQDDEKNRRRRDFRGFCVDTALMAKAKPDALFMHCLPAYRGLEVTADVIDGPQSVVWDEAENRLHAQKALMEFLLH